MSNNRGAASIPDTFLTHGEESCTLLEDDLEAMFNNTAESNSNVPNSEAS